MLGISSSGIQSYMNTTKHITHLVFDMGGVLIRLQWHENVSKILGRPINSNEIHKLWVNSPAASSFDKGLIDFDTFYDVFQQEFDVSLSRAEFEQLFADMLQEDYPETLSTLKLLSETHSLALLSNTNPFHWEMIRQRNTFLPIFNHVFTSISLGLMKPDPKIYQKVQAALGVDAGSILFFDDSTLNVESARASGWNAEVVHGMQDVVSNVELYCR